MGQAPVQWTRIVPSSPFGENSRSTKPVDATRSGDRDVQVSEGHGLDGQAIGGGREDRADDLRARGHPGLPGHDLREVGAVSGESDRGLDDVRRSASAGVLIGAAREGLGRVVEEELRGRRVRARGERLRRGRVRAGSDHDVVRRSSGDAGPSRAIDAEPVRLENAGCVCTSAPRSRSTSTPTCSRRTRPTPPGARELPVRHGPGDLREGDLRAREIPVRRDRRRVLTRAAVGRVRGERARARDRPRDLRAGDPGDLRVGHACSSARDVGGRDRRGARQGGGSLSS